jgi:hypothetical protein
MVVRIAEIEAHPQYLKDYLEAARNVGAESVKKELGVICIFPNQMTEDENKIRIVFFAASMTCITSAMSDGWASLMILIMLLIA